MMLVIGNDYSTQSDEQHEIFLRIKQQETLRQKNTQADVLFLIKQNYRLGKVHYSIEFFIRNIPE